MSDECLTEGDYWGQRATGTAGRTAYGNIQHRAAGSGGMVHGPATPVRDLAREGGGQAQRCVRAGQPDEAAIRGPASTVKPHGKRGWERIWHGRASWFWR